jgi:hypothetical protein
MSPFSIEPDHFDSLGAEHRRWQNHDAKDIDVNEHERLSNITLRHKLK